LNLFFKSVLSLHFHRFFLGFVSMATKSKSAFAFIRPFCLVLVILPGLLLRPALAADTNAAPEADGKTAEPSVVIAQDFLRSYLQTQEQLHDTQMAIEQIRQESIAASASNSAAMEERLRSMEKTIANDRLEQLGGIAHLDRTVLIAASVFAFIGFLALFLAAYLQWTAVNRLSAAHSSQGLATGEALLPSARALEQSNVRFLGLMERLEQRLHEMETSVNSSRTLSAGGSGNGSAAELASGEIAPDKIGMINLLLNKSQTLIKLDKTEAALDCLDEVLALDPGNADAMVKKGAALEHLQRIQEAIECYDRAIAQDGSMVMAYLCKAGLLNRMERHSEALACYEQALKPRQTARPQTLPLNTPRGEVPAAHHPV
jgi:tetratricopeptide (TPR) repeat protein